ncbi:hypothetical protein QBC44DRAFT_320630 [Cladorrhinum sp. PSN332]|nr:hypothetical protein QBC44DRAFT_320630 [Cladorrhinum sp. PSN332]
MDPVSGLGAAAAGIQVVDVAARALLGGIKLIRDLRDTPNRTRSLLDDVERSSTRVSHICTTLLQPRATLRDALCPEQYDRLLPSAQQVSQAMNDAQGLLLKLCGPTSSSSKHPSRLRQTWKAAEALVHQEEVAEKLKRVDRVNTELLRELQIVGLEMQATSSDLSSQILSSLSTTRDDMFRRLDNVDNAGGVIQAALRDNQDMASQHFDNMAQSIHQTAANITQDHEGMMQRLEEVHKTGLELHTTMQQNSGHTSHILGNINSLREEANLRSGVLNSIHHDQRAHSSELRQLHLEAQIMRAELQAMGNNLIKAVTSNATSASQMMIQGVGQLTRDEMAELERGVQQRLIQQPSALRDAHQKSLRALKRFRSCNCRPTSERSESRSGRFSLVRSWESQHHATCPLYDVGYRSWHYTLAAQLFPFLNKTMELTVGAAQGAGWWSIRSPLRFRGTVRRSESPTFRLLDGLIPQCTTARPSTFGFPTFVNSDLGRMYDFEREIVVNWDIEKTRHALGSMLLNIRKAIGQGTASGADVDEMGNSFFSALLILVIAIGDLWECFADEIENLLHLATTTGSDTWHLVSPISRNFGNFYYLTSSYCLRLFIRHYSIDCTALGLLLNAHLLRSSRRSSATSKSRHPFAANCVSSWRIPLYAQLDALDLLDTVDAGFSKRRGSWAQITVLYTLISNPGVMKGMQYDDLALAVVARRYEDVKKLAKRQTNHHPSVCCEDRFSILALALGWYDGLRLLVSFNYCPIESIKIACGTADIESLDILLETAFPIFSHAPQICLYMGSVPNGLWTFEVLFGLSRKTDDASILGFQSVVDEFKRRRQAVNRIALDTFPLHQIRQFGLSDTTVLDRNADEIYRALAGRVAVPASLDCCRMGSIYNFKPWSPLPSPKHLKILFEAGFTEVDTLDVLYRPSNIPHPQTLLQKIAISYSRYAYRHLLGSAFWLLKHGAKPRFETCRDCPQVGWPTLLFYLAEGIQNDITKLYHVMMSLETGVIRLGSVIELLSPLRHLIHTLDSCICFCSSSGCLATSLIWRITTSGRPFYYRHKASSYWNRELILDFLFSILELDEEQIGGILFSICRVEIFERLGMAHTCCGRWTTISEEEHITLREEDGYLLAQLDLLMGEYRYSRTQHTGSLWQHWNTWWQVVDMILPPLSIIDAKPSIIRRHWGNNFLPYKTREEREREALIECGYDPTTPFEVIIAEHFEKYREGLVSGNWPDNEELNGDWLTDHECLHDPKLEPADGHIRRSGWVSLGKGNVFHINHDIGPFMWAPTSGVKGKAQRQRQRQRRGARSVPNGARRKRRWSAAYAGFMVFASKRRVRFPFRAASFPNDERKRDHGSDSTSGSQEDGQ